MRRYSIVLLAIALLLTLFSSTLTAQDFCREAVGSDMASIGQSCQTVDANTLCLAQGNANVSFLGETKSISAGDQVPNSEIETIVLGTGSGTGVSDYPVTYLRTQANLPAGYANNNVVIVATGPVIVADGSRLNGLEPFTGEIEEVVTTVTDVTEVLSFPPTFNRRRSTVVGELAANSEIRMDVRNENGTHVRISYEYPFGPSGRRVSAWVPTSSVADSTRVSALPAFREGQQTPMQSILIAPSGDCTTVPTKVFIQSPGEVSTELAVNGLDFVLSSAVVFNLIAGPNGTFTLQVIPVMGLVYIPDPNNPDDPDAGIQVTPTTFIEIPVRIVILPDGSIQASVEPEFFENFEEVKQAYIDGVESGANLIDQSIIDDLAVFTEIPDFLLPYELEPPIIIVPSGVGQPVPIFETFDPPTS